MVEKMLLRIFLLAREAPKVLGEDNSGHDN
jgi:hypothetical protein